MKTKLTTIITVGLMGISFALAHSEAIKPDFVDMLLKPYFELQTALAGDNLTESQKHAKTFNMMLGHGPSPKEASSLGELGDQAQKIMAATNIAEARSAFLVISNNLAKTVEHVGTSGQGDVMLMHCPMAFGGKGGEWLQNHSKTANPYFGAMMYSCGSVKGQLTKGADEKQGAGSKHNH